ncbi:MAG TPA: response regulator [Candidatus Baltobacteraceae bacterium]|nr:response regulator [Candidatus Baltobacteraceae bacterium]
MNSSNLVLSGSYNYGLVALSVLIAVAASYAALDLGGRVTASRAGARRAWLTCGAVSMGIGIWSMHYVGMLAFHLPIPVEYDWPTVLVSLVAAIIASAIALYVVSRERMGIVAAAVGSVFMGGGIASMHYIGMAAMRMRAMCNYSKPIVAVSIVLAVVISFVALLLSFHFRSEETSGGWRKALSAVVMGAAIPVMHYTGMAAASFTAVAPGDHDDFSHALDITSLGTAGIVVVTFAVLGFTVITALLDRRFAAEIQQSNELVRLLLDSAPEAIYGADTQGICTFCNRSFLRLTGYESSAEVLGREIHPLIHHTRADGSAYPVAECRAWDAFRTGKEMHVDDEVLWRKNRTSFPAEYWSRPIHRGGQMIGAVVTFVDVTERKKAEATLRENEQRFRAIFEGAPTGIAILEIGTGKLAANQTYQRMLGCTEPELRDVGILNQLTHPDDREAEKIWFQGMLEGKEEHLRREKRYVPRDGKIVWADIELSLQRDANGKPQFVLGTAVDITERKRIEAELQRAKEAAEGASRAKSTFLATMSHEIRTPMNGILGMTELVMETELTTEQREHLGLVRLSAESLLTIINDVLDFSKIEAGKLEIEAIPFDLRESLGEMMQALSIRAHQKGLELVYDVEPDVPEGLLGDPGRIRQILVNLVGNAIKFTERGEVFVNVHEELHEPALTRLHFAVKDTGVGVPEEKQKGIFEAFSQADGTMARKYGGTGLGLTICTRLVSMMGGKIWVESQPGQGSTFHFTLQLAAQDKPAGRPESLETPQLRDLHALIVDDNFTNRKVLSGMLTRWGMKPTAVEGGRAALQALQIARDAGNPFPLILLDGQMPEMDGFALAEHIRKDSGTVKATIMMLTSAGHLGDAARCRELGISAYLVKPIRQAELLHAIRGVLNLSKQNSAPLVTRHTLREDRNRAKVLLVEDNAVNQSLAVRVLEKRGYNVSVACDGREALAAIEAERFDVVLMDVQMPEMDGFEATAAIRQRERSTGGHVPVVAMTAHALKGDEERCLAAGMDAYISKPIRTSELFTTLERLLRKNHETGASDALESEEKPAPMM